MEDPSSLDEVFARLRLYWTTLDRGWQAVIVSCVVAALVVLAP